MPRVGANVFIISRCQQVIWASEVVVALLLLLLLLIFHEVELVWSVDLNTEEERGTFLCLEDFGFLHNNVQYSIVTHGAVHEGDVYRARETSVQLRQFSP